MATEKVGIYRKYHGPIPKDKNGNPLPKKEWIKKRAFRWAVRWFGSDGKRYSKSFKTRKEAERYAEEKQADIRVGKQVLTVNIRLKDFKKEHLMLMQNQIAPKTLKEHERALRYLLEIIGDRSLRKISPRHAELYVKSRVESGVSTSTINKEITTLRSIFRIAAERRGYLPEGQNCFKKVSKRKVSRKSIRYITITEFQRLFNATTKLKWEVFLSLLYTTGLRLSEALNLTWLDIDFELEILQVSAKRDHKHLIPWEPKDHELRNIPLCNEMVDLLNQWRKKAPKCVPYVFLTAERYKLVMTKLSKKRWNGNYELVNNVLRDFKVIQKQAKIDHCSLHDFRRSCITNWARKLPAHVVRKLAGHSSLETTMKFYLAVGESDLAEAKNVNGNVLKSISQTPRRANLKRDQTDPKLTHFRKNKKKSRSDEEPGKP